MNQRTIRVGLALLALTPTLHGQHMDPETRYRRQSVSVLDRIQDQAPEADLFGIDNELNAVLHPPTNALHLAPRLRQVAPAVPRPFSPSPLLGPDH